MFGDVSYPVKLKNPKVINDKEFKSKSFIVKDPDNIRSRFAAFDPWRINSATAAAMGVAAPDLLAAEPDKKAAGGLAGSLIRKVGEVASKTKPFYSAVDEAIAKITQGKGTGEQFLSMIKKTPGVKPKEIKDRGLDKLLTGKMTKADVEKIATDNPPPQIFETTLRGPVEKGSEYRTEYNPDTQMHEVLNQYSMPVASWEDDIYATAHVNRLNQGKAKFADTEYVTKGGTNHREILFRMPSNVPEKESALRSWHEQMKQKYKTIGWKELATTEEVSKNNALVAALKKDQNAFKSQHYDEPNILAHARVSDRIGPNGEKILHVDEIQSDWHQKARDARKKEIKRLVKNGMTEDDAKKAVPSNFGYSGNIKELPEGYKLEEFTHATGEKRFRVTDPQGTVYSSGMSPESATKNAIDNLNVGVPDAPFKSDWQELVMKRLLDDAARNGYDRVTITPGAEQAKRYGLSKQVDEVIATHNEDGTFNLNATMVGGGGVERSFGKNISADKLPDYVGKDLAKSIQEQGFGTDVYNGDQLKVGGEGMKGFYDQMLPAFVNRYGEKTGLRMNLGDTPVDGKKYKVYEDNNPLPWSIVPEDGFTIAGRYATQEEADRAAIARATQPFHSIDITPEFRESVTEKGQPFYQIGAGSAIGAAASQDQPEESANFITFRKGGEVNLDAMNMAVWGKKVQHKQYGGVMKGVKAALNAGEEILRLKAAAKAASVLPKGQQAVLSAAESKANLEKFLSTSQDRRRLYHATPANFSEFQGKGFDPTISGNATWLTANKEMQPAAHNTSSRKEVYREGVNVMPVYVQAERPLVMDDKIMEDWAKSAFADNSPEFPFLIAPEWLKKIKAEGYDSIFHPRSGEVIMLEPNKIKSAIGNRGTYDIGESDISKDKGGSVSQDVMRMAITNKQLRKRHG